MLLWPGFRSKLKPYTPNSSFRNLKYDGEVLFETEFREDFGFGLPISRSVFHRLLVEEARRLQIPLANSADVVEYLEDVHKGTVVLADGRRLEADLIVAADGAGTKSASLIRRRRDLTSSGYSVYRAAYPLDLAMSNDMLRKHWPDERDEIELYLGKDQHSVVGRTGKIAYWTLTHMDVSRCANCGSR